MPAGKGVYELREPSSDAVKWTATRVNLVIGSHSILRICAAFSLQRIFVGPH